MKFDINAARSAGYSDEEIADYLAQENGFDLGGALQSGYSQKEVLDYLAGTDTAKQDLPAGITPSEGRSGTPMGKPDPRLVKEEPGLVQRVANFLKPAPKSVLENYQPTPEELQADASRRLSYGAGPISSATAAKADLVRSGMAKTADQRVNQVARAMQEQGTRSFGDLVAAAKNPVNERAAREAKADEFRTPGEWAVDTLSSLSQGAVGLVQLPINIIAPSSDIADSLRSTQKELQAAESDVLAANRERLKERVLSEEGFLSQYVATVKELVTSPSLTISEAAKQLPNFLGVVGAARLAGAGAAGAVGLAGRASPTVALAEAIGGNALQAGARVAGTAAGGAGASMVMAGGDAAGEVYDSLTSKDPNVRAAWAKNPDYIALRDKKIAGGMDRLDAAQQAIEELATTKARMAALITAPLGLLGYMGAEAAVASRGLGRATAEALTPKGMLKTAAKDLAGEQLEEGGTQFGANVVKSTVDPNQSLTEGVAQAMGTALVTSAPFTVAGLRSQYNEARQGQPTDLGAERAAAFMLDPNSYDSTLIDPSQTVRRNADIGPSAPAITNFTPADSPSAQAGLAPIVVPDAPAVPGVDGVQVNPETERAFGLDTLRMGGTNVGTTGTAGAGAAGGSQSAGDLSGAGLGNAGLAGVDAQRGAGVGAAGLAPVGGAAAPLGGAAGQQPANLTAGYNNAVGGTLVEPWFGRKGGGYSTVGDAQQAIPDRQRKFPNLEWRIERMPNGNFMLGGYEINRQETTSGTQAPQTQQGQTQGFQAPAGAGAVAATGAAVAPTPAAELQGAQLPRLKAAPPVPQTKFAVFQKAALTTGHEIEPLRFKDFSNTQKLASVVARMLGKTFSVARVVSGDPSTFSNGMINRLGGEHIVVSEASEDAPIFVAIHEAYHGLPDAQRKQLNAALLQLFRQDQKGKFLEQFNYSEDQFEEEAPAYMAQVISRRADFWEELRTKMGNREFAEVAKVILAKLNQILTGTRQEYGDDFVSQYITDIAAARDLLTTAYAEAMRAQGLQPDATVTAEADAVMASNKAESIGAKLRAKINADFDAAVREYYALPKTKGGRILDVDLARELSEDYRADRTRAKEVHEAASDFIEKLFEMRVREAADTGGLVAFMAGGGGAGKSSAEDLVGEDLDRAHTVLDGTLSTPGKAERLVNLVIGNNQSALVVYIYRDPVDALANREGGVLVRAMNTRRTVPLDSLVKTHSGSSETVRMLEDKFAGNPAFDMIVVDNSKGFGKAELAKLSGITPVIKSGLKEKLREATDQAYADGVIDEDVYQSTVEDLAEGSAPAVAGSAQRDQRGAAGEVQQGRGPEGQEDAVARSNPTKKAGEFSYTVDEKGRATFTGDIRRIRLLTKKIASGTVLPDDGGIRFKSEVLDQVKKALAKAPKVNPQIASAIQRTLSLSDAELAATSLAFQTGEGGNRAFVAPIKGGIPDTVKFLEDRRRASGLRLLDINNPEDQDTLAKLIAAETLAAIRASGNALEWYDETIAKTLAMASVKYPELAEDRNAQMIFRLAMAITSQGLNVENNLKFTMRQYDAYRKSAESSSNGIGKYPEVGEGDSASVMENSFRLINNLLDEMGPDMLRRFLVTEFTIGELNEAGFEPGGELVDEKVLGSSILGPKIGFGFYSNLNGNFEPVTMDMWFMRTIGRLTGYLRAFDAEKFSKQVDRFRNAFDQRGESGIFADRFDADLVERARTDNDAAIELARKVTKAHEKDYKDNREKFDSGERQKSELVYAAATMIVSVDKPNDSPGSGSERRLLREVVRKAVSEVEQAYGQRVPPAAMQALIWYPEQELYSAMGVDLAVTSQDYAGATEKVLKEEGYDEKRLRSAAKRGSDRVRQAAGRDVSGGSKDGSQEARRAGPLEGTERDRFIRDRYERVQLELERAAPKRKGIIFEVAPDPDNERLTNAWNNLDRPQRLSISGRVARDIIPRVLSALDTDGIITAQVGSYGEDTNPSFILYLDKGDAVQATKMLGFVLAQKEMVILSPKEFKGGMPMGAVEIELGEMAADEVEAIYQDLRNIEVKGNKPVLGQSYFNGRMLILNDEAKSEVSTEQLASLVNDRLNNRYNVTHHSANAAFIDKKDYDYASEKGNARGNAAALRERARALRSEATAAVERELEAAGIRFSRRAAGPAEPARGSRARTDARDGSTVTGIHYGKTGNLSRLSGTSFGSGIKGAEQARLAEPGVDPRIKRRVYFYLTNNNADMPRPEAGLGSHVYRASLGNMYDPTAASSAAVARVRAAMQGSGANAFESAVLDAGFRGYVNREQGTAVVLDADVPVAYEGMAQAGQMRDRKVERVQPAMATRQEGNEMVRRPTGDEMMGIVKARPALAEAAPSFRLQFGEARVAATEVGAANAALAKAGADFQFDDALIDEPGVMYSRRTKPDPVKTVKAYKLFRADERKPGQLFPLFVNANDPVEMDVWLDADIGPAAAGGKVKSKLGPLAFRPGWHAGDLPIATHIGEKSSPDAKAPDRRPANHVWAEVEMAADRDWQTEANKRGVNKAGKLVGVKAHITDQIPEDGYYRYKTNPNMTGNWLIGGSMKVTRILSDDEVRSINEAAGTADLPRAEPFDAERFGFDVKSMDPNSPFEVMRSNRVKMAPIEEPNEFDAKPGDEITVVRLASMPGLDNTNAASIKGLATYLSMVDDFDSSAGSEAAKSDTIFVYKVKVPEGGFGDFSRARGGNLLDGPQSLRSLSKTLTGNFGFAELSRALNEKPADAGKVGRMAAKYGGYWYSFPQGTEAQLLGSIPLKVARDTLEGVSNQKFKEDFERETAEFESGARTTSPFPYSGGTKNFDLSGTNLGSAALQKALRDAGFEPDAGGVMFSRRAVPAYTHVVVDPRNNDKVMGKYQSVEAARRGRDRLDNEFGAYRYKVREIESGEVRMSNRVRLADDAAAQEQFLQRKAEEAGYKSVDEFVDQDYDGFVQAAAQWREENPAEVMYSRRSRDSWFLGRDATGRIKLGAGAKAYRLAADLSNSVLDKVGLKPISTDLGRAMRQMKVEIEKARELTADVSVKLSELSPQERELISDVIEKELKRGVKPPKRVLEVAASMKDIMSEQTAELVRLGMLSEDAAGRWDGKYLPRFYESKLKDEGKAWAKAAKSLFGRAKTMQGIGGSSLKGRGLFQTIPVEELEAWLAEGWEERDPNFDPDTDTEITVWRDYTRKERENMGEIRDAMFRFIMGYNKSQRDIALGRLYENLANTVASRTEKEGYVQVPRTNVEDTYAKRYGKLAGKWVPKEVLDHLSAFDEAQNNALLGAYRKAMSMWKEGKTVLNPVSHMNNILSNVTMAHFAGVSYWDVQKYLGATRDIVKNSPMLKEAKEAGLWLGTMTQSELVNMLPDQLKVLAAKTESKAGKAVDTVWDAMSFWLRKPFGKAYEAEDLFFRFLIYRDARGRGLDPAEAVEYAQKYIFTYDDLPKGARMIRDYALPFFAYTYKVVPALAQTALEQPWRLAAPAAILYTVNAAMYAIAAGADDDDWMELIERYMTDSEFREKARALEKDERANLPSWMKGATALGTPKAVRLGVDEATGLPLFLDVARVFPGGDLFDAHNNAGGVPLLAPITPNHPILTVSAAMLFNKDTFRGTELVKASDTDAEAAAKRSKWLYQQIAPAIAIGNGHFDRAMNVIANATGEPLNLFFTEYTGIGRDGMPVQPGYAAMQTVGIKVRPYDLEAAADIAKAQQNKLIREIDAEIRSTKRLESRGAITSAQAEQAIEKQKEKRQRLKEGLTVEGEERE